MASSRRREEISLEPRVLRWARERSALDQEELARKAGVKPERVRAWEETGRISLAQVAKLSRSTHTPEGFLFLDEPPEDRLEIPDLRTIGDLQIQPSPDLIETVHTMERRQAWMREELIEQGADSLPYVGSASIEDPPEEVAVSMREAIGVAEGWASEAPSWIEALRLLMRRIDEVGILVAANGIVGNDTHRKLDPDEFQGFALVDQYAPLIFVNAADYKAAQMFTLAHESAHIWLAASGVSKPDITKPDVERPAIEERCNAIAAEFLIPAAELRRIWGQIAGADDRFQQVARRFKTSRIVAARRALDIELISRPDFFRFWEEYEAEERRIGLPVSEGGDFWKVQGVRLGRRFTRAVVSAVLEGRLLYRDAYALTNLRSPTFEKLIERTRESV